MSAIGETLRRERVRQGLDLQSLSQTTKIGTRMLQAIETGDFAKLPGGVFTRNFIKQYALALGVDPAGFEQELSSFHPKLEESVTPSRSSFLQNEPISPGTAFPTALWVVLAGIVCGGVYYLLKPSEAPRENAPPVAVTRQTETTPERVLPNKAAEVTPLAAAVPDNKVQVILSALDTTWVSISVDGKVKFTGILQPNDRREFSADDRVKVVAGNAGGIDILLNGKNIDSLGPKGQPRTVELTRAGAQVVSRVPKAEPLF